MRFKLSSINVISMKILALCLSLLFALQAMPECGFGGVKSPSNNCIFPKFIEGCLIYSSDTACYQCEESYDRDGDFCSFSRTKAEQECCSDSTKCQGEKLIGCLEKITGGQCSNCALGFTLTGGRCEKQLISGCQRISGGICLKCRSGLNLTNGGCVPDFNQNRRCESPFYENGRGECVMTGCKVTYEYGCASCEDGFKLLPTGMCQRGEIEGCQKYTGNGRCEVCSPPLYRESNGFCLGPGCLSGDSSGCNQCDRSKGFVLQSGSCKLPRCLILDSSSCLKCEEGYVYVKDRGCQSDEPVKVCSTCAPGFTMNSNQNSCYRQDQFCKRYNFQGRCSQCMEGYSYSGVNCVKEEFGCQYTDGICTSCSSPFEFNAGSRTCFIDGCLRYFSRGCQRCDSGMKYKLQYNLCKLPNCLSSRQGICTECNPNYIRRSDGICINRDEFCLRYDDNGFCLECSPETYMSMKTNRCMPKQPGCVYDDQDQCSSCALPFKFDGIRCDIANCIEINLQGCRSCLYPFTRTQSGDCSIPFCVSISNRRCVRCESGYTAASDGRCKGADPNCVTFGASGCDQCVRGYKIDGLGICQYADQNCWSFTKKGRCDNCDRHYFINEDHQCQIKDPNCQAYFGGKCSDCKPFFYFQQDICYPNAKGCITQKNWGECEQCEGGYNLEVGKCIPAITRLTWDSVDMNFWGGETDKQIEDSHAVFSLKSTKYNLDPAIAKGNAEFIFSSNRNQEQAFQVDDYSSELGWQVTGDPTSQYLGIKLDTMETFYAVDIKTLRGNTMTRFSVEESDDGYTYTKIMEFSLNTAQVGVVQTFYFTPFYAKFMRIVVLEGNPSIKFEFYYSNGQSKYQTVQSQSSIYAEQEISYTVEQVIHEKVFSAQDECIDQEICWMGLELCEAQTISGFTLDPRSNSNGQIQTIEIRYSVDGVKFQCYQNCQQVRLSAPTYSLRPAVMATKLRIYPKQFTGQPSYTVTFNY